MNTSTVPINSTEEDEHAERPSRPAAQPQGFDSRQSERPYRGPENSFEGSDAQGGRRILVPLDGSRRAAAALPYALALAHAAGWSLSLLAVVEPRQLPDGLPRAITPDDDERHVTLSSAYLESVAADLRASGLVVTTVIRHGDPASEILADSEQEGCALIAMGTHGRTGLARLRTGSVAQRVLRHAVIPTLVVPPGDAKLTRGAAQIAAITATLDGSVLAEGALPLAASLAAALAVPLGLLRAIPGPAYPISIGWDDGYYAPYIASEEQEHEEERAVEAYLEAIAAPLRTPALAVETAWVRGVTNVAAGPIAEHLARRPSGLAVMTSHGRTGLRRWALGSTAESVLDQAPCPILIVPADATIGAGHNLVPARAAQHGA
ncbi:MAG TPA: universal stress protein [Thermomicrobiales bacterium]|jgi:nucleotide-binding universal stress UspA family protein